MTSFLVQSKVADVDLINIANKKIRGKYKKKKLTFERNYLNTYRMLISARIYGVYDLYLAAIVSRDPEFEYPSCRVISILFEDIRNKILLT